MSHWQHSLACQNCLLVRRHTGRGMPWSPPKTRSRRYGYWSVACGQITQRAEMVQEVIARFEHALIKLFLRDLTSSQRTVHLLWLLRSVRIIVIVGRVGRCRCLRCCFLVAATTTTTAKEHARNASSHHVTLKQEDEDRCLSNLLSSKALRRHCRRPHCPH